MISSSLLIKGDQQLREIHRQNQITQQILSNYLERKLFPFRRPNQQAPSIEEILPTLAPIGKNHNQQQPTNGDTDSDSYEDDVDSDETTDNTSSNINADSFPETLQSVESEHLDSYYDDEGQNLLEFYLLIF